MHVDIAKYIGANVAGLKYDEDGSSGTNVFVDELPAGPDQCVAVVSTGGSEADSKLPYDAPACQIFVRSDASPVWGIAMCDAIYSLLHGKRNIVLEPGDTYLVYALFRQSSPNRIGADENGRQRYTMNVRAETYNATSERPS